MAGPAAGSSAGSSASSSASSSLGADRPLSPHIQIYKPIFTMVMSIFHRITGTALYFGMALLAWWLIAAATSAAYFDFVNGIVGSLFGRVVLLGFTWALVHHALGGLRHFIWDMGYGLEKVHREALARLTLAGSLILTPVIWLIAYAVRGG